MDGRLVRERDWKGTETGRSVCVSCGLWNCWHAEFEPCDVTGCQCELGGPGADAARGGLTCP